MNIVVKTFNGRIITRPDTTWERNDRDFFVPDFIEEISGAPVIFARISRPGKSIRLPFADRYYDAFGQGVLLYPENLIDGSAEGFAEANCINHTSFLPADCRDKSLLDSRSRALLEQAIEQASFRCFLRAGDLLAVELEGRRHLCSKADKEFTYDNRFKIIF